ncbi:hypothetical protein FNU79_11310 [Deinococcus detaillensis]|uniref:Lipoprotein n=1 Tax=Deinococcus detaillensis TaxID=2592048 RepID=A0A553UUH8_9DEIO|nr:hypothetical protein [Deinococcus detaillensis]TSA83815.1 hypothetical protein FNU79_11310 [Deinococcus detaillensis]
MSHRLIPAVCVSAGLAVISGCTPTINAANVTTEGVEVTTSSADAVNTTYGFIGKWMIDPDGQPARWLGYQLDDHNLREPVNVILVDKVAKTPQEAASRLVSAMQAAGYGPKGGHSVGYKGLILGQLYGQQPGGKDEAFSDGAWWQSNNHGRVFGPAPIDSGGYLWTAAFSREDFELISSMHHPYNSFKVARDDLSAKLSAAGTFKRLDTLKLDNALNTPTLTTDDHDGGAAVLVADK